MIGEYELVVNRRRLTPRELETALAEYAAAKVETGVAVEKTPVVLRADRGTPMSTIKAIYKLSQKAKLQTFNFQTSGRPPAAGGSTS
jgi:hypothetical protein